MSERRRIIEGTWKCTSCDNEGIAGSIKLCPNCGNAREDEEAKFDFGKRAASGAALAAATVADAAKLALAAAGADWYCANCGSANRGTAEKCAQCGTEDAEARLAKKPEKPKQALAAPPPPPPAKGGSWLFRALSCLVLLGAGGTLLAVLVVFALAFMSSESAGTVASVKWSRDVHVETFTAVTKEGWKGDLTIKPSKLPVNGSGEYAGVDNLRGCVKKEKSPKKCETKTRKKECGQEEKCEVKDLGNGFAEEVCKDVTKYCDEKVEECVEAVFDEKCTYDTYEWKRGASKHAEGADTSPKWPDVPALGATDRQVKEEKYTVTVRYPSGSGMAEAVHEPATEAEFKRFAPNQAVIVEVNGLGKVTDVEPAGSK